MSHDHMRDRELHEERQHDYDIIQNKRHQNIQSQKTDVTMGKKC